MTTDDIFYFVQNNALADIYLGNEYIGELIGIYLLDNEFKGFIIKINTRSSSGYRYISSTLSFDGKFKQRVISDLPGINQHTQVLRIRNTGNLYFENRIDIKKIIEKL